MRYLIAVSVATGKIVYLFGPYPGASNDLTLVKASGFCDLRLHDEWTLGDSIFRCMHLLKQLLTLLALPKFLTPPSNYHDRNLEFEASVICMFCLVLYLCSSKCKMSS